MPLMQVVLCARASPRLRLLSALRPAPTPAASSQQALPGLRIVAKGVFRFHAAPAPALEGRRLELEGAVPDATRQVDGNACGRGGAGQGEAGRVRQEGKEERKITASAASAAVAGPPSRLTAMPTKVEVGRKRGCVDEDGKGFHTYPT